MGGSVFFLSVLLAASSDAAYALIIGTLLAGWWLAVPNAEQPTPVFSASSQRRLLLACIAALALAHLVHPWFLACSMSGSTGFTENIVLAPTILSSTHQGTLWYINSVGIVALLAAVLLRKRSLTTTTWISIAALCLIAFAKAASGHAADEGDFTLTELSQLLHIFATAVWAGSVLLSGLLILPRLTRRTDVATLWTYGNRLSKTVTWALIALLLSGIYTSDRELNNSLSALWTSSWGKILLIKVAFVLVALSLGAISRFFCLQRLATERRSALLVRLLLVEAVVMLFVLCLSGLLANTAPPMANM